MAGGIPAQNQPQVSRNLMEWTVAKGQQFPEQTESVQVASQAAATTNPLAVTLVWATYVNVSASVASQTSGSLVTVNFSAGVPGIASYAVLPGRQLIFAGSPNFLNPITGLLIQSFNFNGFATTSKVQTQNVMQGGATYTNFIINVVAKFFAVIATSSGTVNMHCFAQLYDIPSSITSF